MLAFEGASAIDPDELHTIVDEQRLERQLFTDPFVVTALLERYYREQDYLSAEIDQLRYEFQGGTARVAIAVREGPRFTVRHLRHLQPQFTGRAREIGLRSRYDKQLHEGRIYINQPALTYLPRTTANIYPGEEVNPPTELTNPFNTTRKGVSIQRCESQRRRSRRPL